MELLRSRAAYIMYFHKLNTIVKLFYRQPNIKHIFTNLMLYATE
jgi:hypothetical protein